MKSSEPFHLICLSCKNMYEGFYNNQICPNCGERKNIRWILKREFHEVIMDPHEVKIENMRIKILCEVKNEVLL